MKLRLVEAIMKIVLPPDGVPDVYWNKIVEDSDALAEFELLLDEDLATSAKQTTNDAKTAFRKRK